MPTTVTSSSGTVYHLFQLRTAIKEYSETKGYTMLENDLSDGYEASVLFGANTGLRRFRFTMPTLADFSASATVTGPNGGALLTPLEYMRSLFDESKVTGTPFVFQSIENDQYYLVKFVDKELSTDRLLVKLYSTGVELRQVRIEGETVFDFDTFVTRFGGWNFMPEGFGSPDDWHSAVNTTTKLTKTGNVTFLSDTQNGIGVCQLNVGATNDGIFDVVTHPGGAATSMQAYDTWIVMEMREATFSNNCVLVSVSNDTAKLIGDDTTTKFQATAGYTYYLNGTEYADANRQAPMNEWGIVHLRWTASPDIDHFGHDSVTVGAFAEVNLAQIINCADRVPMDQVRDITEHLAIKWGIGLQ